jgi:hypothetical protein
MRHAARKDTNHAEIEAVFRKMLADHVTDTSSLGLGVGDLFVSFGRVHYFIEIKRDEKAHYTAHQQRFINAHPHAVLRCETVEQAVEQCNRIRGRALLLAGLDGLPGLTQARPEGAGGSRG